MKKPDDSIGNTETASPERTDLGNGGAEKAASEEAGVQDSPKKAFPKVALVAGIAVAALLLVGAAVAVLCTLGSEQRKALAEVRARVAAVTPGTEAGESRTILLPGDIPMELVWCPAGSFMMGSPQGEEGREDDETQHEVRLTKGFWMAKTEVTQKQWESVAGKNPSHFKGADLPVESVSWDDVAAFCRKTGLQLPTEAQWEYACRAGSGTAYSWGVSLNGTEANCDGYSPCGTTTKGPVRQKTLRAGRYAPNAWGLLDMHGNVWEWCADRYGNYPSGSVVDPAGSSSGASYIYRGGGWNSKARNCRSAQRNCRGSSSSSFILGFRPVLVVP